MGRHMNEFLTVGPSRTDWARKLNPKVTQEYAVPVLIKALAILQLLRVHAEGLRAEQIPRCTAIPKSTIYRILRTFVATGFVESSEVAV